MKLLATLFCSLFITSAFAQLSIQTTHVLSGPVQPGYNPGNGVYLAGIWDLKDGRIGAGLQYSHFSTIRSEDGLPDVSMVAATVSTFLPLKRDWAVRFEYGVGLIEEDTWKLEVPSTIAISHLPRKSAIAFEVGFTYNPETAFSYGFMRFGFIILP